MCDKARRPNSSSREEVVTPLPGPLALLLPQQETQFCRSGCAVRLRSRQPREAQHFLFAYKVAG